VATFTVASTERYQQNGEGKDGATSWVRCNAWRELGGHVVETFRPRRSPPELADSGSATAHGYADMRLPQYSPLDCAKR